MNITLVKHKKSRKDRAAEHVCKGAVSSSAIRQRKLKEVFQRDLLRSLSGAVILYLQGSTVYPGESGHVKALLSTADPKHIGVSCIAAG